MAEYNEDYLNIFLQFKIYSEDLINVNEICSNKCIKNYDTHNLNNTERLCLENCYNKNFEINKFIIDEFKNSIIEKLDGEV